eukprot:9496948-Prorocentrum_lima.AAC.1
MFLDEIQERRGLHGRLRPQVWIPGLVREATPTPGTYRSGVGPHPCGDAHPGMQRPWVTPSSTGLDPGHCPGGHGPNLEP